MDWPFPFSFSSTQVKNKDANHFDMDSINPDLGERGEEASLMATAYDIVNTGLKYASILVGDEIEIDWERRRDCVCYNGYKIKVDGKKLLLESVHINRNYPLTQEDGSDLSSHSILTDKVSVRKGKNGIIWKGERRARIVIRYIGECEAESIDDLDHTIQKEDRKWTFTLNSNGNNEENFVKIVCPEGVHSDTIEYGLVNGVLYIDTV